MTTTTHPSAVERLAAALFQAPDIGFRVCLYARKGGAYMEYDAPTVAAAAKACRDALEGAK